MKTPAFRLHATNEIDQVNFDLFVAQNLRANLRTRDRDNTRGKGPWFGKTDAECMEETVAFCEGFKHQFRIFVPVSSRPVFAAAA